MRTTTSSKKSKAGLVIGLIVTAILVVGGVFLYQKHWGQSNQTTDEGQPRSTGTIDYSPATDEQIQAGVDQKDRSQTADDTQAPSGQAIPVIITSLTASSAGIQLYTELSLVTNQGQCTLTVTNGQTVISRQVGIQAGPSTSTCKGFSVNESLAPGQWTARVTVVSGDRAGDISQAFTVQ